MHQDLRIIAAPFLDIHQWLTQHHYVRSTSSSGYWETFLNYLLLAIIPGLPVVIYFHWLVVKSDAIGDQADWKAIIFIIVAAYLFALTAVNMWTPWGESGALEMALWGGAVLAAITVLQADPGLTPAIPP